MTQIPGEELAKDIVTKASPLAKGVALVLVALIASIGALLYFNKDAFADLRDYKVTIAEMKAELKFAERAHASHMEIITLLRGQVTLLTAEVESLRAELARLKIQPKTNP